MSGLDPGTSCRVSKVRGTALAANLTKIVIGATRRDSKFLSYDLHRG